MKGKRYYKKKLNKLSPGTARAVKKIVQSTIKHRAELKQFHSGVAQTYFYNGAGASIFHLTALSQGLLDTNRIGDSIWVKHVQLRFMLRNNAAATANEWNPIRITVFQYTSQDNAPSASELFLSSAVPPAPAVACTSSRNPDYFRLYKVLYDKTFYTILGTGNAANYGSNPKLNIWKTINVPLKYCKRKVQFESAGVGTVNGLYVCVLGQHAQVAGGVSDPTYACGFTVNFYDM